MAVTEVVGARRVGARWVEVFVPGWDDCPERPNRTGEASPTSCPRCSGSLIRHHDELLCLNHGTVYTPERPWDLLDMEEGAFIVTRKWSAEDDEELLRLAPFLQLPELAHRIGRTQDATRQRLTRLGFSRRDLGKSA